MPQPRGCPAPGRGPWWFLEWRADWRETGKAGLKGKINSGRCAPRGTVSKLCSMYRRCKFRNLTLRAFKCNVPPSLCFPRGRGQKGPHPHTPHGGPGAARGSWLGSPRPCLPPGSSPQKPLNAKERNPARLSPGCPGQHPRGAGLEKAEGLAWPLSQGQAEWELGRRWPLDPSPELLRGGWSQKAQGTQERPSPPPSGLLGSLGLGKAVPAGSFAYDRQMLWPSPPACRLALCAGSAVMGTTGP